MKAKSFDLIRYDSDKGKVFDWRELRSHTNEKGEEEQEHLYARTLFIGANDSIDNYIEVDEPIAEETANN